MAIDVASLAVKIDSTEARDAAGNLDKLTSSGGKAEAAARGTEREWVKASSAAGKLRMEAFSASAAADKLAKSEKGAGAAASEMARQAQVAAAQIKAVGNSSGIASHHMMNLGYQINDVVVGLASGQKPMTVFMQQGAQIGQIMAQSGVSAGGLAKALAGMIGRFAVAHPLLLAIAAAVGAGAIGFKLFADQVNEEKQASLEAYAASIGLTKEQIDEAGGAAVTSTDLIGALWDKIAEVVNVKKLLDDLHGWFMNTFRAIAADARKNLSEIYAAIYTIDDALKYVGDHGGEIFAEGLIKGLNKGINAINSFGTIYGPGNEVFWSPNVPLIENKYEGAGAKAAQSFRDSYTHHLAAADKWIGDAYADVVERAYKRAQGRLDAAAEGSGKKAGNKAGKAGGKEAADVFAHTLEDGMAAILKTSQKLSDEFRKEFEKTAGESYKAAIQAANDNLDKLQQPLRNAVDANIAWNEQLKDTIRWLDKIGGFGSTLGDIGAVLYGLSTGDFSGIGGKGGALIEMLSGVQWTGTKDGERYIFKLGEEFQKSLVHVFGENFGPTFLDLVKGAGTGAAIGGILFDSKGGQLGAMGGGAFGEVLGKKVLSKVLGDFAGPLGTIVGSILGGVLGGALSPAQRGSATFTNSGQLSTRGNNNEMIAASSGIGNAILDLFTKIADTFDATLNDFKFSVGIREGNLRYDPTGQGITKTANGAINFGQDQAALIEYAVRQALSQGVFEGLSDGVKRILDNSEGGSFETQLKKALSFQSVFKELEAIQNPTGVGLDNLNAQFDELRATSKEAGASVEQLSKLEELYGIKRAEIVEQANRNILEAERPRRELEIQLLQAQGKSAEALAAARQLELDGMNEQEQALQKQIYRWQDVNEAYAENLAASARWKVLNDQLLELTGKTDVLRRNELAAMEESLRPLQERIWALQDEQEAARAAAQAADELARAQQAVASERYGLETRLLQLQGDTNALRQRELAALDPTNRLIQQQIYAIEDRQAAEQEAIKAAQQVMAQRNDMISSYNKEASSLSSFMEKFRDLAAGIREFRAGLFAANDNGGLTAARTAFLNTSRLAAMGNEGSLQSFVGVSQTFLSAARENAASLVDYQRAIGLVAGAADAAASGADGVARQAAQQLQAIQATVAQLEALNEATQTNIDTLNNVDDVQQSDVVPTLEALLNEQQAARTDAAAVREAQRAEALTLIQAMNTVARLLTRWDRGDGVAVVNDSDTPLTTVAAA